MKRRWDDDVVFKNQARGTENKGANDFVNVSVSAIVPAEANIRPGHAAVGLPQEIYGM
jgi:hypothetical protein